MLTTPTSHVQIFSVEGAVMASEFSVKAMVHGYHIYEDIWDATVGKELQCPRELDNRQDLFAV